MKIPIGEKIFIIKTGEQGVIKYYDGDTAFVDLDGELIQVHKKDIESVSEFGVAEVINEVKDTAIVKEGIELLFKAIKNLNGEILRYEIYLSNQTSEELLYEYSFYLNQTIHQKFKKEIVQGASSLLHEFKLDDLNDSPVFKFLFWVRNTQPHYQNHFEKEIKLKTKTFFSKIASEEFKLNDYFIVELFSEIPLLEKKIFIEVKEIEEDNFWNKEKIQRKKSEFTAKANMPDFIDLHAEKLLKDHSKMDATEILHQQLNHFKYFLEKAIRYNLHKIYAVHGLGKGVLKSEVEKILLEYPEIKSFNNNYTMRFGFGATEIFLE